MVSLSLLKVRVTEIKESMKGEFFYRASKSGIVWILTIISLFLLNGITVSMEGKIRPRFSIKVTHGANYSFWGDINRYLESVNNNEVFEFWRKNAPERVVGEINTLNNWTDSWEAELRIDLSPKIAVGIATSGAIRRKNESSLIYTYIGAPGSQVTALTYKPEVKAQMPIRLGIYYTLPYGRKASFFFNAAIGYYSGKISDYLKYEVTDPSGGYGWTTRYNETERKSSLGFHSGFGVEYSLMRNLALVVETQGRYVKIKGFKARARYDYAYSMPSEVAGTLYYFTKWVLGIGVRYADLVVWEKPPDITIYSPADIRKAILDLSGFSLRVGIRIKL
jgi:opacity protein-like surface antigen